ncbi:hypothetical protein N7532_006016 [Penicillium argentinense]|uniref:Uncharacterized protein n=1 Tax=Penicillium argentinense TaxID=1131581 RepID=A0A9W9KAH1_9EURO|nr:uncharacterized protein N7532_006016 [Penicillium argentinense]KAJ5099015.1 hypothetical protein N7532_006016 [Penicillium argentinense]
MLAGASSPTAADAEVLARRQRAGQLCSTTLLRIQSSQSAEQLSEWSPEERMIPTTACLPASPIRIHHSFNPTG